MCFDSRYLSKALTVGACLCLCLAVGFTACSGREEKEAAGDCADGEMSLQPSSSSEEYGFLPLPLTIHVQWRWEFSDSSFEETRTIEDRKTIAEIMTLLEDKEPLERELGAVPENALHLQIQDGAGTSYTMDLWKEGETAFIKGEAGIYTITEYTYDRLYMCARSGAF